MNPRALKHCALPRKIWWHSDKYGFTISRFCYFYDRGMHILKPPALLLVCVPCACLA